MTFIKKTLGGNGKKHIKINTEWVKHFDWVSVQEERQIKQNA